MVEVPALAYKVLTVDDLARLKRGEFKGAPVDLADGFIHLSTASQLPATLDKHFAGQSNLVIAAVNLKSFGTAVLWEPSRDDQLFPHLYGALSCADIIAHCPLERSPDGAVRLPGI